jgi:hypothetical protein
MLRAIVREEVRAALTEFPQTGAEHDAYVSVRKAAAFADVFDAKLAPLREVTIEALRGALPPALVPVREAARALQVIESTVRG